MESEKISDVGTWGNQQAETSLTLDTYGTFAELSVEPEPDRIGDGSELLLEQFIRPRR